MINPPIRELIEKVDSRYTLCIVIGKRARQLQGGAHQLTACSSKKPVSIAINEFYEGKLTCVKAQE